METTFLQAKFNETPFSDKRLPDHIRPGALKFLQLQVVSRLLTDGAQVSFFSSCVICTQAFDRGHIWSFIVLPPPFTSSVLHVNISLSLFCSKKEQQSHKTFWRLFCI